MVFHYLPTNKRRENPVKKRKKAASYLDMFGTKTIVEDKLRLEAEFQQESGGSEGHRDIFLRVDSRPRLPAWAD